MTKQDETPAADIMRKTIWDMPGGMNAIEITELKDGRIYVNGSLVGSTTQHNGENDA